MEITIYSIYGSGHYVSSEDKATTLPTLTIQYMSCPVKNTACPTEPFDLTEWILAAGVILFSSPISRTLRICFCKAMVHLPAMAFHLSQGWQVNKG